MIEAFDDVNNLSLPVDDGTIHGQDYLDNVNAMQVGSGSRVFKMDQDGLWLGADKFVDAPFSVDMDGNLVAASATFGQYLTKAGANQVLTGSVLVGSGTGGAYTILDGANNRMVMHDGTTNRVVIGNV